jgi:DNA repair protein RadA/Sms
LGGEPGIGKSTLLLQLSLQLPYKTLYVSGEESMKQIKMRAERISDKPNSCYILTETKTQHIFKHIQEIDPEIVIIDSIQTLHTDYIEASPGSISQIRETTAELIKFAKESNVPVILIGHITKDGAIAGPKILEHMVDTVLQFEGDRNHVYRLLRSLKNRFGSTAELGIYEMQGSGLREVSNPSEILISHQDVSLSGTAISATLEGMRPLMIEIQALVSTAVYGTPQRSTTGYNAKRLNMILAVLEKRAGFRLGTKDVFLNITGGITIDDPAIDLAVVAAILSSNEDIAIEEGVCFAGEIGLSGEIRPVNRVEQRILEAEKLGFTTIFVSKYNKISLKNIGIRIQLVSKIEEVASALFG